ncbi:MAG TPA: prepilin peptidase [Phycisphaerae bacterium]|nr:prepilin peptidase [Phycisphaerae bacterium]
MGTLYWSIVSLLLGGCIGSFLNVVIYRWPRGLSLRKPARSFCPACGQTIAWYDNIPVISYLVLRGRCRRCGVPISLQYPIVELATALTFLMAYDVFFVAHLRIGIGNEPVDAVMLIAHWILLAGLIALTVMDLEAYMVDIRVTWLVSLAGVVGHIFWTPAGSQGWIRPGAAQAGVVLAAAVGLGLGMWWAFRGQPPASLEEDMTIDGYPSAGLPPSLPVKRSWRWLWLVIPVGLIFAYLASLACWPGTTFHLKLPGISPEDGSWQWRAVAISGPTARVLGGFALLFVGLTLAASRPVAEVDTQIMESIESEAPDARRMALWELKLIAPAILLGALALLLLESQPAARESLERLLGWRVWDDWRPALGFSTGLAGWIIGGAVGWLARILFTLLFGKEALGMGDVHILAAAGAVAGWPVAFLGFFLGAMLALAGLVVIRLRRQSQALPYGPWLGLGFFLAVMFQDRILEYLNLRWWFE